MARVQFKKRKSYSGPMIKGATPFPVPAAERAAYHIDRAYWLTTCVETGAKFGAVMAYDGTAMTAGPDQHIAVYPRELADEDFNAADDQGGLWHLLRRLELCDPKEGFGELVDRLWAFLRERLGAYVAQDGVLRYLEDGSVTAPILKRGRSIMREQRYIAGDPVYGFHIRSEFTPGTAPGKVPKRGKQWDRAREVALMFHELTAHEGGQRAQVGFGQEHVVHRTLERRARTSKRAKWQKVHAIGYGGRELTSLRLSDDRPDGNDRDDVWNEELDLALCMYQSHSVNAPSIANIALAKAAAGPKAKLARNLVRLLGDNPYQRWDDDIEHGRYARTRSAAMKSGLWSRSLFSGPRAIMPKDLV